MSDEFNPSFDAGLASSTAIYEFPPSENVVSMQQFGAHLFVATERRVFKLVGHKLWPIEIVYPVT